MVPKESQNGPKRVPKWFETVMKKSWLATLSPLGSVTSRPRRSGDPQPKMEARGPPKVPEWSPRTPKMEPLRPPETPKWSQNDSKTKPKSLMYIVCQGLPKNTRNASTTGLPTSHKTDFVSIFINKAKHMYGHTYTVQSANQPSHKTTRPQKNWKEYYIACVFYRDTYPSIILCLQPTRPLCFDLGPATRTTTVPIALRTRQAVLNSRYFVCTTPRGIFN